MSEFGWTRLAYLSVILAVLAILVKLGTFGAASLSENLPESALAFAQRGTVFEEHLDWEKRAAGDLENLETTRADEAHSGEAHSDDGHSEEAHSEVGDSEGENHGHSHEPVESVYENVDFKEDAPVFYRPAPRVSSESQSPSPGAKSCQTVGDAPPGSKILFPMAREYFDSYEDTWGAARPQGGHEGTDLMAPMGTPEFAITDGTVVPVSGANGNGWNTLGGYTVMIEAAYSVGPVKKGDLFYYAHMDRRSDLRIGDTVKAGDVVGYAGDTGQGPEGARGQFPPHLHLGWYETSGERTQLASGAMNPYPLLEWVKANGGSIAGGSDIPYCEAPQSSAPTPSGGGYWQFPSDPGVRPDIATGTGTAAPSPVALQNDSSELSPDITREPRQPTKPPRPANPAPPPEDDPPPEPPSGTPPSNGVPSLPSIPNPLPGIGADIGNLVGGIFNPDPPSPPDNEPTAPPPEDTGETEEPPTEGTPPGDTEDTESTPPEETTPEETTPEETTPEETVSEGTVPKDEATDEEGDKCDPREHGDGEEVDDGEPHEGGGEDCPEGTDIEDEEAPPDEEADGPASSEAVEGQYDGEPKSGDSAGR